MEVTIKSLSREPCAVKVARTVLTGGLGRRTIWQRALILPTAFLRRPLASAPRRCAARAAARCSQPGQAAPRSAARSAPPRRAGEALPLAAAAGPGSQAKGRQAAPLSPTGHASAAPDCPGAAPCAGGAWTAGALVQGGGGGQSARQLADRSARRGDAVRAAATAAARRAAPAASRAASPPASPSGSRAVARARTVEAVWAVSAAIACMATQR